MIAFLVMVLAMVVVVYCIKLFVDWCEVAPPIRTIILLITCLACIYILLSQLGVVGQPIFPVARP